MKLCTSVSSLLFIFVLLVNSKVFITIDGNEAQFQPPIVYIIQPYDPNYWYAPYYGPYISEPVNVTYQSDINCLGGQRDVIIGLEEGQTNTVLIFAIVGDDLSMASPVGFIGSWYLQYDGNDTNGTSSSFPGGLLNSPGIGSGVSSNISESDGLYVDFSSFGRALGINIGVSTDTTGLEFAFTAVDIADQITELTFIVDSNSGDYFFRFDNSSWTNPSFDWTAVGAFQVKINISQNNTATDVEILILNILGYEVSGSVFVDTGCDSSADSLMPGIELNLYNGLTGTGPIISTTTTDSNGDFAFYPQSDGDHTICLADRNVPLCANSCISFTLVDNIDQTGLMFPFIMVPSATSTSSLSKTPTQTQTPTTTITQSISIAASQTQTPTGSSTNSVTPSSTMSILIPISNSMTSSSSPSLSPSPTLPEILPPIGGGQMTQTKTIIPKIPSPNIIVDYSTNTPFPNIILTGASGISMITQPCLDNNSKECVGTFSVDPVSPSGTKIIVSNPNLEVIKESDTQDVKSVILDITLDDNSNQLGGDVEVCIQPTQSNSNVKELCLGFLDESSKPPIWKCEDNNLKKKSDGLLCGKTNHFTNFAILLAGTSNSSDAFNDEIFIWLSISLISMSIIIFFIAAFMIETRHRYRKRKMSSRLKSISQSMTPSTN